MKRAYKVIGILILIAAIICAGVGIYLYIQEQNAGAVYDEIRQSVKAGNPVDICYSIVENYYRGIANLQLRIKDIRDREEII